MTSSSIMSVGEMIEAAFGDNNINVVNFQLIQTVLYIIARQLRVLERRVLIKFDPYMIPSNSNMSITEVKIQASIKKKKKSGDLIPTVYNVTGKDISTAKNKASKTDLKYRQTDQIKSGTKRYSEEKSHTKKTEDKSHSKNLDKSRQDMYDSLFKIHDKLDGFKVADSRTHPANENSEPKGLETTTINENESENTLKSEPYATHRKTKEISTASSLKKTSKELTEKILKGKNKISELTNDRRTDSSLVRKDSSMESDLSPIPMASTETLEIQKEKLLIVERIPSKEAGIDHNIKETRRRTFSVVTTEQFESLVEKVKFLETIFGPVSVPGFPDNVKLMKELRKGASLTDAMAGLQLSARLDGSEKTLEKMITLLTELAVRTPGVHLPEVLVNQYKRISEYQSDAHRIDYSQKHDGIRLDSYQSEAHRIDNSQNQDGGIHSSMKEKDLKKANKQAGDENLEGPRSSNIALEHIQVAHPHDVTQPEMKLSDEQYTNSKTSHDSEKQTYGITFDELDHAMEEFYTNIMNEINRLATTAENNVENAKKITLKLEEKLDATINLESRIEEMENLVKSYVNRINSLDTSITSQMTNHQEELTQMQYDLEGGLEAMAEAVSNRVGDTSAVNEMNANFTNLQTEIDNNTQRQKELQEIQCKLLVSLEDLYKQIELLKEAKVDRDEVVDALKDKAGIAAWNGIVSLSYFEAVRGDFEKRIGAAYDKFNNQELLWEKAIEDLLRLLGEKADVVQIESLRNSIEQCMNMLRDKLNKMMEIVGEPKVVAVTRKIHQVANCISCKTPAHMSLEEPGIPMLPGYGSHPTAIGAELEKVKEYGDHGVCYPGHPTPQLPDPRSHLCNRYCGRSRTVLNKTSRLPVGMTVMPTLRQTSTVTASDRKSYTADDGQKKNLCLTCIKTKSNKPSEPIMKSTGPELEDKLAPLNESRPIEINTCLIPGVGITSRESSTPSLPFDEDRNIVEI